MSCVGCRQVKMNLREGGNTGFVNPLLLEQKLDISFSPEAQKIADSLYTTCEKVLDTLMKETSPLGEMVVKMGSAMVLDSLKISKAAGAKGGASTKPDMKEFTKTNKIITSKAEKKKAAQIMDDFLAPTLLAFNKENKAKIEKMMASEREADKLIYDTLLIGAMPGLVMSKYYLMMPLYASSLAQKAGLKIIPQLEAHIRTLKKGAVQAPAEREEWDPAKHGGALPLPGAGMRGTATTVGELPAKITPQHESLENKIIINVIPSLKGLLNENAELLVKTLLKSGTRASAKVIAEYIKKITKQIKLLKKLEGQQQTPEGIIIGGKKLTPAEGLAEIEQTIVNLRNTIMRERLPGHPAAGLATAVRRVTDIVDKITVILKKGPGGYINDVGVVVRRKGDLLRLIRQAERDLESILAEYNKLVADTSSYVSTIRKKIKPTEGSPADTALDNLADQIPKQKKVIEDNLRRLKDIKKEINDTRVPWDPFSQESRHYKNVVLNVAKEGAGWAPRMAMRTLRALGTLLKTHWKVIGVNFAQYWLAGIVCNVAGRMSGFYAGLLIALYQAIARIVKTGAGGAWEKVGALLKNYGIAMQAGKKAGGKRGAAKGAVAKFMKTGDVKFDGLKALKGLFLVTTCWNNFLFGKSQMDIAIVADVLSEASEASANKIALEDGLNLPWMEWHSEAGAGDVSLRGWLGTSLLVTVGMREIYDWATFSAGISSKRDSRDMAIFKATYGRMAAMGAAKTVIQLAGTSVSSSEYEGNPVFWAEGYQTLIGLPKWSGAQKKKLNRLVDGIYYSSVCMAVAKAPDAWNNIKTMKELKKRVMQEVATELTDLFYTAQGDVEKSKVLQKQLGLQTKEMSAEKKKQIKRLMSNAQKEKKKLEQNYLLQHIVNDVKKDFDLKPVKGALPAAMKKEWWHWERIGATTAGLATSFLGIGKKVSEQLRRHMDEKWKIMSASGQQQFESETDRVKYMINKMCEDIRSKSISSWVAADPGMASTAARAEVDAVLMPTHEFVIPDYCKKLKGKPEVCKAYSKKRAKLKIQAAKKAAEQAAAEKQAEHPELKQPRKPRIKPKALRESKDNNFQKRIKVKFA